MTTTFLTACAGIEQSGSPSEELIAATRPFLQEVIETGHVPAEAIDALSTLRPNGAAWVAVVLGSGVERGVDPERAGDAIVALFQNWVSALAGGSATEELKDALPTLGQSTVAHLARLPKRRAALAADAPWMQLLAETEGESHAITWVRELLRRRSGDLILVHAETKRVVQLRFTNVANCFHLFSLIQTVIGEKLPGGRTPDPSIAAATRGNDSLDISDEAWWHYQLRGPKPLIGESAWGEADIETLRHEDGTYAMALWSTLMSSRRWGPGFFSPALEAAPSDMEWVTELKGAPAQTWCDRLL